MKTDILKPFQFCYRTKQSGAPSVRRNGVHLSRFRIAMRSGSSALPAARCSHDGGIDGIINEDRLGLDVIYIQAKRFNESNVGICDDTSFVGALSVKKI